MRDSDRGITITSTKPKYPTLNIIGDVCRGIEPPFQQSYVRIARAANEDRTRVFFLTEGEIDAMRISMRNEFYTAAIQSDIRQAAGRARRDGQITYFVQPTEDEEVDWLHEGF